MHWSLSKKKAAPELLFHVGSAFVSGTLFRTGESGTPEILFSVTEPIALGATFDTEEFFAKTLRALESVVGSIHNARLGAPSRIFSVLASPWYRSQTRHVNLRKDEPFTFTEKIADELIQREIKLFHDEHLAPVAATPSALRTIELKNIKTLLNGYDVPEPLYKKCRELDMALFISMSGESVLTGIEKIVRKYFHFEQIKFSSFAAAAFTVARDLDPTRENFLLIDVGGEVTDIFLIKRHILGESASFPLGRNFLVRGVADALRLNTHEAASLISLVKEEHATEDVHQKLTPILGKLENDWIKKFQESLAHLSSDISIPGLVYLSSEGAGNLFASLIQAEQWGQYILAESKFEIRELDMKILHPLADVLDKEKALPPLVIDSVYISRFLATI